MTSRKQTTCEYGVSASQPDFSTLRVLGAARIERAICLRDVLARFGHWIGRRFAAMRRRQHQYDELMSLDDRILADIGISRGDIPYLVGNSANVREAGNDNGAKAA